MKIGQKIKVEGHAFTLLRALKSDGAHANTYVVEAEGGNLLVMKKFLPKKKAYGSLKYRSSRNHFGRAREAHQKVFQELKSASQAHDFLVEHLWRERISYSINGQDTWSWVIIQNYVDGTTIGDFAYQKKFKSITELSQVMQLLGKTLGKWHRHQFAHGDPHIYNAMVTFENDVPQDVVLIDYSQVHHPEFHFCKECGCFTPENRRFREDLENEGSMGKGFLHDIRTLEKDLHLEEKELELSFLNGYKSEDLGQLPANE